MKKCVFLLLATLLAISCGKEQASSRKAPVRVKTLVASTDVVPANQGYVGIVEEREATAVSFTGMGVVKRVFVDEGQSVTKGQLLAEMDDTQARNLLSGAEAAMTQANDAYDRYKQLHDNGSLPEVKWVEVESKVAQAKSQLEVAKKNLSDCRLTAPVSGIVGKKLVKAGETALPSQAVVTILDISSVKVKVAVPEGEIGGIAHNTRSVIKVDAVGGTFEGGPIEKGVQADALTHTYDIRIIVANGGRRLLPGMVADVSFAASEGHCSQLAVPVTAVQRKSDGSLFVWRVAGDSTAHRTPVSIGGMLGNNVTVTEGIEEGQRIVTEGYQKLSEGNKVVYVE